MDAAPGSAWAWSRLCSETGQTLSYVMCSMREPLTHPTQLPDGKTGTQRREGLAPREWGAGEGSVQPLTPGVVLLVRNPMAAPLNSCRQTDILLYPGFPDFGTEQVGGGRRGAGSPRLRGDGAVLTLIAEWKHHPRQAHHAPSGGGTTWHLPSVPHHSQLCRTELLGLLQPREL